MPRLRQSAATATGPSSRAGLVAPQATFHSRAVPTTRRAVGGDEGEPFGRQAAVAQALGGLAAARCVAEGLVEQRLARFDVVLLVRDAT